MRRLLEILKVTKSKCVWSKYINNETMQITNRSGIYTTIYHNGSYFRLFGKKQ